MRHNTCVKINIPWYTLNHQYTVRLIG
uniref:Uncharacterized protein n=1 Tax=Arundo donax TaxID=35708 RepID=A0A0A9AIG1_ARUDO